MSSIVDYLSSEILAGSVLPFLTDTPAEILRCTAVCRSFREACKYPSVWQAVGFNRYGKSVAERTEQNSFSDFYTNWKEAILKDDNAKMALPTISKKVVCNWRYNQRHLTPLTRDLYYYCVIQGIKWSRSKGTVSIYIEARGERDLRHPRSSCVRASKRESSGRGYGLNRIIRGDWTSAFPKERPGHYKGCLTFPATFFKKNHRYEFQYASNFHDYDSVLLFSLAETTDLKNLFKLHNPAPTFSVDYGAFFMHQSEEEERKIWEDFVPQSVLDRNRGEPDAWWVEREDDPSMILSK